MVSNASELSLVKSKSVVIVIVPVNQNLSVDETDLCPRLTKWQLRMGYPAK